MLLYTFYFIDTFTLVLHIRVKNGFVLIFSVLFLMNLLTILYDSACNTFFVFDPYDKRKTRLCGVCKAFSNALYSLCVVSTVHTTI